MDSESDRLEGRLEAITDCLKTASKYGGRVFGGYVRDVIIPRYYDPKCDVSFKDVDIWFDDEKKAGLFVKDMDKFFTIIQSCEKSIYPFGRILIAYTIYGTFITPIDIIICETIPIDDFDVNQLTVSIDELGGSTFESWGEKRPTFLMEAIKNKTATILPSYMTMIIEQSSKNEFLLDRMKRIFLNKGWTVRYFSTIPIDVNVSWMKATFSMEPTISITKTTTTRPWGKQLPVNKEQEATDAFELGIENLRRAFTLLNSK